jgi:outer membrane protein OmpA-like peptidoglycan-associated protein
MHFKLHAAHALRVFLTSVGCGALVLSLVSCSTHPAREPVTVLVTATSAEPAPYLDTPLWLALEEHADSAVRPESGEVYVLVSGEARPIKIDLTPMRAAANPPQVEQVQDNRHQLIDAALNELDTQFGTLGSEVANLDLLDLLSDAVTLPGSGPIYVLSSGLQTVDPLDMRKLGWTFDADAVASVLASENKLPDLSGREVVFVGLGHTAGAQPEPPISSRALLRDLWLSICDAAGATSCSARETGSVAVPPVSIEPVPVVEVVADTTPCTTGVTLSGDILFKEDEPTFKDDPTALLSEIADELKRCPEGVKAIVVGHTARVSLDEPDTSSLSEDRALAVYAILLSMGVPADVFAAVRGVGDTEPLVDNMPGGHFVESLASQNRRVEVIFIAS